MIQPQHALAHFLDEAAVVGSDQNGCSLNIDALKKRHDFRGEIGIEIARGLIRQQHQRVVHQGPGDGHALLLAA